MKRTAYLAILIILLAAPVSAFDNFFYTDTRAFSVGKAFTGLADDQSALFYNAAGIAYIQGQSAGLSGVYRDYSWGYTNLTGTWSPSYSERGLSFFYLRGGIGVSFSIMGEGLWEKIPSGSTIYDPDGTYTVTPVFYERYLTVTYAREVIERLSLGVTVKYINTDDPFAMFETKNGFTFDAGILYAALENLSIGLSVANILSSGIDYVVPDDLGQNAYLNDLPRNVSVGAAYRPHPDIVIAVDAHNLFEDDIRDVLYEAYYIPKRSYHIGCEWRATDGLYLRAGYFYDQRMSDLPSLFDRHYEYDSYHNATFGAGIVHKSLSIDAGIHFDDRKSQMEEHPIELNNTTLMGFTTVSFAF